MGRPQPKPWRRKLPFETTASARLILDRTIPSPQGAAQIQHVEPTRNLNLNKIQCIKFGKKEVLKTWGWLAGRRIARQFPFEAFWIKCPPKSL